MSWSNIYSALFTVVANWSNIASALFTAVAALAAWRAVAATRNAARTHLLERLISEYDEDIFGDALRAIREMRRRAEDLQASINLFAHDISRGVEADADANRRRVHRYFKKIAKLHRAKALADDQVRALLSNERGYTLWRDFVLPVARRIDTEIDDTGHFEWADELLRRFPPP
jgi:hypothetical protein